MSMSAFTSCSTPMRTINTSRGDISSTVHGAPSSGGHRLCISSQVARPDARSSCDCVTGSSKTRTEGKLLYVSPESEAKVTCLLSVRMASAVAIRIGITLPRRSHRLTSCSHNRPLSGRPWGQARREALTNVSYSGTRSSSWLVCSSTCSLPIRARPGARALSCCMYSLSQ
jgi:hypothetical protein